MQLVSVCEAFLYYCCLLLITRFIMDNKPRIFALFCSYSVFIPLAYIALKCDYALFIASATAFQLAQFLLIKIIFKTAKLKYLIFAYVLINCFNAIIIATISNYLVPYHFLIDLIVNSVTTVLCAFMCLTKTRFKIQQYIEWLPGYILLVTFSLICSTLIVTVLIFGIPFAKYKDQLSNFLPIALSILQLAMCIILPIVILNSISNSRLKNLAKDYEHQIQVQSEHYKNLAAANHDVRRFKHDFKNISIAIEKLLADGKQEQALDLIRKYSGTMENVSPAFDTGNGIADALLTDKQKAASSCNAKITFQGAIPQDVLSPTDLCVILGNTLDNAIEACQKLPPEMSKTISVTCQCSSGFLFVSIENPVAKKVAVTDNHIFTTKDNKTLHGFGLYSLQSVVKKYSGEVKLTATDDLFTVDIDLCLMDTAALS